MDPSVVFDCQKVLPNRFALAMAAAARSRALKRGRARRLDRPGSNTVDLALEEIASGLFTEDELAPFLPSRKAAGLLPSPAGNELGATPGMLRHQITTGSLTDDRHGGAVCCRGIHSFADAQLQNKEE